MSNTEHSLRDNTRRIEQFFKAETQLKTALSALTSYPQSVEEIEQLRSDLAL